MAKALKVIGTIAVVAGLAIVTGGAALGLGVALSTTAFGVSAGALLVAGAALSTAGSLLSAKPKAPATSAANADRLQVSIDVRTPRKIVFGSTAMATDLRDQEWSGNQEVLHRFIVVASHKVQSIREIWFDDALAWSSAGGVQGKYAGYLTVTPVLEGSAANAINIGPRMGGSRRYTGCAYVYLRYKLTGNSKKTESPFAGSIPSRMTIVGDGMPLYDPRLDSTVPGGSGPQRANDQSTWAWTPSAGRNNALQLLTYHLGWRINGKLAVGKGLPWARLDLPSFMTGANICDEGVATPGGGSEPRYRSDGIFSEGDPTEVVNDGLKASMNAILDDVDGKIRLTVLHNDLAAPIGDLTTADVLGEFSWSQTPPLNDTINVIRGGFTDPSPQSLYQVTDYPEVRIDSPDGIDRPQTVNLALVQSATQAQRLVKLRLARAQYGGTFTAVFQATAWKFQKGDVIRLSFYPLGWENKLFRIADMAIQVDGTVPMMLREEHADIYAAYNDAAAAVQATAPTSYDPALWPVLEGIIDAGRTAEWDGVSGDGKPADDATNSADPSSPFGPGRTVGEALATLDAVVPIAEATELLKRADLDAQAVQRQATRDLGTIEATLLRGVLEANRTREVMRDAGITVDPVTGTVRIHAIDQVAERTSTVEIALDATKTQLSLRATRDYVNAQIAMAQLDPSGQAALDEVLTRVTSAEVRLDGAEATIALKADAVTLTQLSGTVTTVEQELDALAGVVSTKASQTSVDQLGVRVGSAEQQLLVLGDTAGFSVTIRQARLAADKAGTGALASLLTADAAARRQIVAQAEVRQEIYTRLVDGDAAEAAARTLLSVRMGAAEARAASETLARVTGDQALSQQINALSASFDEDLTATVATLQQAITTGDQASATSIAQVSARLNDFGGATIEQRFSALVTRTGKIEAKYTLAIDVNGNLAGFQLIGSEAGPASFNLINTDLRMGTGRVIFNNGSFMQVQGVAFGANGDLIEWFGPTMALAACTRANATAYKSIDGHIYSAAGFSAGGAQNSGRSTSLAANAIATMGPFGTNGKRRVVTASYTYFLERASTSSGGISGSPTAALVLERQDGSAWTQIGTINATGSTDYVPAEGDGAPGYGRQTMSGAVTVTEPATGTSSTATYRLRLTNRSLASFNFTSPNAGTEQQTLNLQSIEE